MLTKEFYLIVGSKRRTSYSYTELTQPRVAARRGNQTPPVKRGEVAILVKLALPTSLFQEPQFSASISVDESAVTGPTVSADVINNIQEVVPEATGLSLTISGLPTMETKNERRSRHPS